MVISNCASYSRFSGGMSLVGPVNQRWHKYCQLLWPSSAKKNLPKFKTLLVPCSEEPTYRTGPCIFTRAEVGHLSLNTKRQDQRPQTSCLYTSEMKEQMVCAAISNESTAQMEEGLIRSGTSVRVTGPVLKAMQWMTLEKEDFHSSCLQVAHTALGILGLRWAFDETATSESPTLLQVTPLPRSCE